MQVLRGLEWLPEQSLDGGLKLLRLLLWRMSYDEKDGKWSVYAGDQAMLRDATREAADAFICGMALVLSSMPLTILKQYKEYADAVEQGNTARVREFTKLGSGRKLLEIDKTAEGTS